MRSKRVSAKEKKPVKKVDDLHLMMFVLVVVVALIAVVSYMVLTGNMRSGSGGLWTPDTPGDGDRTAKLSLSDFSEDIQSMVNEKKTFCMMRQPALGEEECINMAVYEIALKAGESRLCGLLTTEGSKESCNSHFRFNQ